MADDGKKKVIIVFELLFTENLQVWVHKDFWS